jgi:aminoglycoside 3-N-acetyltransferase
MNQSIVKKLIPAALKRRLKSWQKKKDFKKFQSEALVLTKKDLIEGFKKSGIEKGDTIFVHSSLKGLGYIENGAKDIIDAFQEVLTEEGNLVFPTFTITGSMTETLSNQDIIFDPKTTVSTVGSITNHFLKYENVFRSLHPTHSVAAWGKNAKDIAAEHYELDTNFGPKTPFGKFLDLNGKVVGLGIDYGNVTYYHVYEDFNLEKWPDVYLEKPFKSAILDHNGDRHGCDVYAHNPEFHKTRIEKKPEIESFFCDYLEKNEISFRSQIGQGHIWWMKSKDLIHHLDLLYKEGKSIYKIK